MRSNYGASSSIASLLFAICFEVSIWRTSTSAIIEIKSNLKCRLEWQTVRLLWNRTVDSTANSWHLRNSSSFWEHRSESFKKTTAAHLLSVVKYGANSTSYSCHGNVSAFTPPNNASIWNRKLSFLVDLTSTGARLVDLRYIQVEKDGRSEKNLEVYIRPAEPLDEDVNYNLMYCWWDKWNLQGGQGPQTVCPKYTSVRFRCYQRKREVYEVPNSRGLICVATVENAFAYAWYKFYIVTNQGNFSSESEVFTVQTKWSDDGKTRRNRPGEFKKILVSQKISHITAKPTELHQVILQWPDVNAVVYELSYNCSNGVKVNMLHEKENTAVVSNINF